MSPATLQTLQAIGALFTIVAGVGAIAATVVCLKISQQVSELKAEIAEKYVSKEDLRTFDLPQSQQQRKASAHA